MILCIVRFQVVTNLVCSILEVWFFCGTNHNSCLAVDFKPFSVLVFTTLDHVHEI